MTEQQTFIPPPKDQAPLDYASPRVSAASGITFRELWDSGGMLAIFGVLFAVAAATVPGFFSWVNLISSLGLSVTTIGIISCTMLFCLAAGDFDLSVGQVVMLAGVLSAIITNWSGSTAEFRVLDHLLFTIHFPKHPTLFLILGILGGIAAGGVVGLVNGFVIARLGINALITTLATMQIVRGVGLIVADGSAIGVRNPNFLLLGSTEWLGVPTPLWIMTVSFVVYGLLLHRTTFGRNTLAIGGNKEAARLAGISVVRTKITIFTLQGLMAGFAGVIAASQFRSGQVNTGEGLELRVISACVLGGVSLTGGIGTIFSVIVGVVIMGTVQNIMDLKNVPTFYQYVASGSILLAAVLIDRMKRRG
jgi:L-arabinose transport system permease protein